MSQTWIGGCLCGAVRYQAAVADDPTAMSCHCRDCQRATGGPCASFFGVALGNLGIEGPVKVHAKAGDSGREVQRFFCGDCGSPLYSVVALVPGMAWVKIGTLDDPNVVAPKINIWTRSAVSWAHLDPELPAFETGPTR